MDGAINSTRPTGQVRPERAVQQMVAGLAAVAVQGERLQSLCDDLRPALVQMHADPLLRPAGALLSEALVAIADIASDIAAITDALAAGMEPHAPPQRHR
ncbi:hypothetical protein HLB44_32230 [Aquincola sp. S2]|uniref:Uncharacterized protein n=1 Tax=Pseudaquabacterium terrae TaxID=2732868 RepID=A0ABX2ESQ2_9BURK|nr:hypothetical protein [Aquabacterium terrae]NRF71667.1 hypothetical protein [Aquabacterium terrae]